MNLDSESETKQRRGWADERSKQAAGSMDMRDGKGCGHEEAKARRVEYK